MDLSCPPALPRPLLDWLVASERELAAAGDEEAQKRLEALLERGTGHAVAASSND